MKGFAIFPKAAFVIAGENRPAIRTGDLPAENGRDFQLNVDAMAITLVHELGHHFGLSHNSANSNASNLMFPSQSTSSLSATLLTPDQIREMHDRLANNVARRVERNLKAA